MPNKDLTMVTLNNFNTDDMALTKARRIELELLHKTCRESIKNSINNGRGSGWAIGEDLAPILNKLKTINKTKDVRTVLYSFAPRPVVEAWLRSAIRFNLKLKRI